MQIGLLHFTVRSRQEACLRSKMMNQQKSSLFPSVTNWQLWQNHWVCELNWRTGLISLVQISDLWMNHSDHWTCHNGRLFVHFGVKYRHIFSTHLVRFTHNTIRHTDTVLIRWFEFSWLHPVPVRARDKSLSQLRIEQAGFWQWFHICQFYDSPKLAMICRILSHTETIINFYLCGVMLVDLV